ncbi:MAG: adenosine kinase [Chloroflexi bacterium]|nr:adenosine kinase [Chloroflexota bacterium]
MNKGSDTLKDVVGIGNAMVDILAPADEAFLAEHNFAKGAMILIEAEQAAGIHQAMGPGVEMSGGSVGNTMAGIASLGGTGSYIGKVHKDRLGMIFHQDLQSLGITFSTKPAIASAPTARCLIIVTPDGQRSMATYLGACVELGPEDIDAATIRDHRVTYLEGYLWDAPRAKEAMIKAAQLARDGGRQVALTLSDHLCVDRHRESFRDLILNHVDILFANEQEIISLYQAESVHAALELGRGDCELLVVTRSAEGSLIASGDMVHQVNAVPVERVVDTTGAGDLYAAGFLFGITHGYDPAASGRIGAIAAGEIISHIGARPETDLRELTHHTLPSRLDS